MAEAPRQALGFALRLLLAAALTIAAAAQFGPALARAGLPLLAQVYDWIDDDNRVVALTLADRGAAGGRDRVYRLTLAPQRPVVVGGRLAAANPEGRATVSTLAAHLWQPALMALPFALAWPLGTRRRRRELALRLALLPPLLAGVALLDIPWVLRAQAWRLYLDAYPSADGSPLLRWEEFLAGGGRHAIGIAIAGLVVVLARRGGAVRASSA